MRKPDAWGWHVAGAAAARTGDEMAGSALLLAGLAATGSSAAAASLLAAATFAAAVGGPVLGVLLDRSRAPGRLLAGALGLFASALLAVLAGLGRVPLPLTVVSAVFMGLWGPALSGGWTSQLPRVVPVEGLARAHAVDAMTFSFAGLVGPALAGGTAALAGAPAGVALSAALVCLALPAAWALPPARNCAGPSAPRRSRAVGRTAAARTSAVCVAADLAAGFRALARVRPLARATATSVIACVGEGMLVACSPLLGERALGSADRGALLLAVLAASALAANAVLARRPAPVRPDTVVGGACLVLAAALLLAATGGTAPVVLAAAVAGAAEGPLLTALFAIRHRDAPPRLRGQVFTTGASLKVTGFAVGAGVAGPLAAASLPGALLVAAGAELLAAVVFAAFTAVGRRTRPPAEACDRPGAVSAPSG